GAMLGVPKVILVILTASVLSGSAIVALTGGAGPGEGSDYGLDTDGDGAYDWLVVRMAFAVDEPDYYNVQAILGTTTPFGRGCYAGPAILEARTTPPGVYNEPEPTLYPISWTYTREFLERGDHVIALAFRGTDLGIAGVDGPYVVEAQVSADMPYILADGARPGPIEPPPAGWTWRYTTAAYAVEAFETPRFAVQFTGATEDLGLDLDGDGLFDYLVVRAEVQVNAAGAYSFGGTLTTSSGDPWSVMWVTGTSGTVDLAEGVQTLAYRFDGGDVRASGHEGTFDFQISVYYGGDVWGNGTIREGEPYPPKQSDFDVYGDARCGTTSSYRPDQFEERVEPAKFTGVFRDRGEDRDGDGLFEALAVDAEVEVLEANPFEFSGQLMAQDGSVWIAADYQYTYLEAGVQTLTLRFSGPEIARSGVDGPYRVDMNLFVAARDPEASFVTGPYAHADFEADETGVLMHYIQNVTADASAISVVVVRGNDMLDVVIEDVLTVEAYDVEGRFVFQAQDKVYLPTGGSAQSFAFRWAPGPGTYLIHVILGPPDAPLQVVELVVEL
ncbi:MAG: hypothetical protein HY557_01375, partial [Euryarchaeota archaeon]|nr:hypothetical protein [Euryarchaeota archaeon]